MKPAYILCFSLAMMSFALSAQSNVTITFDSDVEKLLDIFSVTSETSRSVDGWRVQILATTDRRKLEAVERQFKENYPSVPIDWVHASPYYKLRAGAFQTKMEAERLKARLGIQFEGVYLVKDHVGEHELLNMY